MRNIISTCPFLAAVMIACLPFYLKGKNYSGIEKEKDI
jgi:hypothetical protein